MVTSDEVGSVNSEVGQLVQKDLFCELISIGLSRHWRSLVSWPCVAGLFTALIKQIQT